MDGWVDGWIKGWMGGNLYLFGKVVSLVKYKF